MNIRKVLDWLLDKARDKELQGALDKLEESYSNPIIKLNKKIKKKD